MRIYFQKVTEPGKAVCNTDAALWHVRHGWYYNVWDCSNDGTAGRMIGAFYVTQLCGFGGILHFETVVNDIPWPHLLASFRKGIRLVLPYLTILLATIPKEKPKLIQTACRLGFQAVRLPIPLSIDRVDFELLQYFPRQKFIVKAESK